MFESVEEQNLSSFSIPSPKGEYVLIVMPSTGGNALNDLSIADHVRHYMQSGMTKKDAIKRTASDRNVDKTRFTQKFLIYKEEFNGGIDKNPHTLTKQIKNEKSATPS